MKPKKGLGKGLDALLGGYNEADEKRVFDLSIELIDANKLQPRKDFDEEKLAELAASISEYGVIQPIIVVKQGERYLIVAGERRFRAAGMAGLTSIPAILRDADEAEVLEVALIENIQRENLNPIEEANAISFLMERYSMTQEQMAKRISKSRSAISNSVRLLTLPERVRDYLSAGVLSTGHAKVLGGIKDKTMLEVAAERVVKDNLSVRELELLLHPEPVKQPQDEQPIAEPISQPNSQPNTQPNTHSDAKKPRQPKAYDAHIAEAEDRMRKCLGTKVTVVGSANSGKIEIQYYTAEDLQHIYSLLTGESD